MAKQIYIIITCDEWKSHTSMRLYAATTSLYKLERIIRDGIKKELFWFRNSDFSAQAREFHQLWIAINKSNENLETKFLTLCKQVKYVVVQRMQDGIIE